MVDTGTIKTSLVHIVNDGDIHTAWLLPSGEVLVTEFRMDEPNSPHYQLHEHVDGYKQFVSDIPWIAVEVNKLD